ncbi:MAG: peptidoglycan DD-metalloendopeptidase family protein [bacterium]
MRSENKAIGYYLLLFLLLGGSLFTFSTCAVQLGVQHKVREGETLWRISRAYEVDIEAIMKANGIDNARQLRPGMKLVIPGEVEKKNIAKGRLARASSAPGKSSDSSQAENETDTAENSSEAPAPGEINFSPVWPVEGRLVQRFRSQDDPTGRGIRIEAPEGNEVKAIESGNVKLAGRWEAEEKLGKIVIIYHNEEFASVYAHLDDLSVREGEKVERGQVIGKVGKSGMVDKPQCYLEIRYNLQPEDPLLFLEEPV